MEIERYAGCRNRQIVKQHRCAHIDLCVLRQRSSEHEGRVGANSSDSNFSPLSSEVGVACIGARM
eukprot:2939377-Pleurochrysis_carterae.AAC.1